jgi:lipopolysaccharide/colanic/teichoic acid biosynthesis glycosyltransferase
MDLRIMTLSKRLMDIAISLLLALVLWPILLVLIVILAIFEGRPFFYISERMKTPTQGFSLIKLRTMRSSTQNTGVTGGDKSQRMSRLHQLMRKTRADELPQLYNVLRGDISLVGPRPPLRVYVDAFPALYGRVLRSRPGVTGFASLTYHAHEEMLLERCTDAAQTDAVYRRACIPRKARLDLIYQANPSLCFDLLLIWQTAKKPFQRKPRSED